jgi:surface antigen
MPNVVVNNIPEFGATVAWPKDSGYYDELGHVGIVEKVYDDGSFDMSHSGSTIVFRRGVRAAVDRVYWDNQNHKYYLETGSGKKYLSNTHFIHFSRY